MNYYNDNNRFCCQWLRNLIAAGHIGDGKVDERSIHEIQPSDLDDFTRCHFFAGIAGWEYALQLADWPPEVPVWTGSCPCQPFSTAGKQKADEDERHLWPEWFDLIRVCRPPVIFGEQVEAAIGISWLDRIFDDMETENYACGAVVLPACSVGAPHIRQRIFWVADSNGDRTQRTRGTQQISQSRCEIGGLAESTSTRGRLLTKRETVESERSYDGRNSENGGLGESNGARSQSGSQTTKTARHRDSIISAGFWSDSEWLPCSDGKWRRTQSGIRPLAPRLPGRVGQLRAYGNSIVPQVAAEFIKAYMDLHPLSTVGVCRCCGERIYGPICEHYDNCLKFRASQLSLEVT